MKERQPIKKSGQQIEKTVFDGTSPRRVDLVDPVRIQLEARKSVKQTIVNLARRGF